MNPQWLRWRMTRNSWPNADMTAQQAADYLEEQRRLFHVGITRVRAAPDQGMPGALVLTYARKMSFADARRRVFSQHRKPMEPLLIATPLSVNLVQLHQIQLLASFLHWERTKSVGQLLIVTIVVI